MAPGPTQVYSRLSVRWEYKMYDGENIIACKK